MKIIAIIQARLSSTRLPKKILLEISKGKTFLECMLERVGKSKLVDKIMIATTDNPADKELVNFLEKIKQPYFVGDENDVLRRYYETAKKEGCEDRDVIVRLTSDCPLIGPKIVDGTVDYYLKNNFDYASNNLEPYNFPDGMDTEVFSFAALKRAVNEAKKLSHREHVTFYFWKNPEKFKIGRYDNKIPNQGGYRLTLDYPEDYEVLRAIYDSLYKINPLFSMEEIIDFLDLHPEIMKLNAKVSRNASWQGA